MSRALHTNFPVENDDNMMLESSLPLIIIVLSIAEVTQITAAICSLKRNLLHVIVANKNYDEREVRQCTVPNTHTHADDKNPFYDLYNNWQNHKSVLHLECGERERKKNIKEAIK